jgi:hypothetical protein
MEITTGPTPLLPVPLTASTVNVSGSGTCLVNGTTQTVTISGSLEALPGAWSCVGGVASGDLTYTTAGMGSVDATTTIAFVGAELSLVAALGSPEVPQVTAFSADGEFVLKTESALRCVSMGATMLDWVGAFAFAYVEAVIPGTGNSAAASPGDSGIA